MKSQTVCSVCGATLDWHALANTREERRATSVAVPARALDGRRR
jgi:hypothetical protein